MKLKTILIYCLAVLFQFNIQAQSPILDSTVCLTVGDLAQIKVINNALSISPGSNGPAQTYDYSVLPAFNSNYEILGVDNLTSPFGNTYPTANATVSWSSFGTPYYHFLLSDTSYQYLGGGGSFGDYQYIDTYKQLQFPFAYNDSYTDTFIAVSNTGGYRAGSVTVTGDGYGTLMVPGHTFTNVLRVKRASDYYDTINNNPRHSIETYYEYYKPGIPHYILLHGFYTISTGSSNPVSGAQLFFNEGAIVTGEKVNTKKGSNYFISQRAGQSFLMFQDKSSFVTTIQIYNLQGQLVRQDQLSVSNEMSSKILVATDLASGIYMVQCRNFDGELVSLKWSKE
jgi:hypothetical protein